MLLLPSPPRRCHLRAFVVTVALAAGLALVSMFMLGLAPWGVGLGTSICLTALSVAFVRPNLFRKPYYAWNRMSDLYLRGVRWSIKTACFSIITVLHQRHGSPLRLETDAPQWIPRASSDASSVTEVGHQDWRIVYVAWVRGTGKWWALSLLPFLIIFTVLDRELEPVLPSQTYTLF